MKVIESGDEELGGKKVFEKIDLLTGTTRDGLAERRGGSGGRCRRVWEKQEAGVVLYEKSEPELFWTNGRVEGDEADAGGEEGGAWREDCCCD